MVRPKHSFVGFERDHVECGNGTIAPIDGRSVRSRATSIGKVSKQINDAAFSSGQRTHRCNVGPFAVHRELKGDFYAVIERVVAAITQILTVQCHHINTVFKWC